MMMNKFFSFAFVVLSASAFAPSSQRASIAMRTSAPVPPASPSALNLFGFGEKKAEKEAEAVPAPKAVAAAAVEECDLPEELTESQELMNQIKEAGTAGIISYILWEWAFWIAAVPVVLVPYHQVTGHWPDFGNKEDMAQLGAEAFAFVNFARFAVPLRIGLALGTTPWVQDNVVDKIPFLAKRDEENCEAE